MSLHKIHTRIVIDSLTGKVEEDEFYWHDTDKDGPISQLNGGGGADGEEGEDTSPGEVGPGYGGDDEGSAEAEMAAEAAAMAYGGDSGDTSAMGAGAEEGSDVDYGGHVGAASVADFTGPVAAVGEEPGVPGRSYSGPRGYDAEAAMEAEAVAGSTMMDVGSLAPGAGPHGGYDPFPGLIDPTWGWGIDDTATYGYDYGLDAAGERITDDIDGGSDGPGGGTPAPGAPGPGAPGAPAPGTPGGPLAGSIIPPWWSGSPHAEYEWGRYGTPYAIPSPRWEGGTVPEHLTGYMPHYEGLLENAYTYPDIKALGLIYGAPPPAPPAEEEDDDDDGEEEESGGETE